MNELLNEILDLKDDEKAEQLKRFFKSKKGEYGYGDAFLGIKVGPQRSIAKKYYKTINDIEIDQLIKNKYHEVRLITLFIMRFKYEKGDEEEKNNIVKLYLENTKYINNWDLVDSSAPYIIGHYCYTNKKDKILITLSGSNYLWEERISILGSGYYITKNDFDIPLKIITKFINHKHDLIHKACGWMLREIGKRNIELLRSFLNEHIENIPRTELRYSIEKMDKEEQKYWLKKR